MIRPMTYPPYSVQGEGQASWITDSLGNHVVVCIYMAAHYEDSFPDMMAILCDALNARERKEEA